MKKHQRQSPPTALNSKLRRSLEVAISELGLSDSQFPPFETWEELEFTRSECGLGPAEKPPDGASLKLAVAIDCVTAFEVYLCGLIAPVFAKVTERDNGKKKPKLAASLTLISGMASDVGAILHLVRHGYDIQAKIILRSLREKLDALIAVQLDRAFAVAFIQNDDPKAANRFWHARVAKGRLVKNIVKRLAHYHEEGDTGIDDRWLNRRRNFDRWLGMAVHPSHTTGLISLFPQFGNGDTDTLGISDQPSDNSIPTLRAVIDLFPETLIIVNNRRLHPTSASMSDFDDAEFLVTCHERFERFLARCFSRIFRGNEALAELIAYANGISLPAEESHRAELDHTIQRIIKLAAKKRALAEATQP